MDKETYSKRIGKVPSKKAIQIDSMDTDLRTKLWNVIHILFIQPGFDGRGEIYLDLSNFFKMLRIHFYNEPIDEGEYPTLEADKLKQFIFKSVWYRVYDLIQIIPYCFSPTMPEFPANVQFRRVCNDILESESAPCRFVGHDLLNVVEKQEIEEIEEAISEKGKFTPASNHLKKSITLLADKKNPDYSNSIKESISAVEATCQIIANNPKATLGDALRIVSKDKELHPALKESFEKIYGYTSDADGIRHAFTGVSKLAYEDAKFMLVSCSAFVNYLIVKVADKV